MGESKRYKFTAPQSIVTFKNILGSNVNWAPRCSHKNSITWLPFVMIAVFIFLYLCHHCFIKRLSNAQFYFIIIIFPHCGFDSRAHALNSELNVLTRNPDDIIKSCSTLRRQKSHKSEWLKGKRTKRKFLNWMNFYSENHWLDDACGTIELYCSSIVRPTSSGEIKLKK